MTVIVSNRHFCNRQCGSHGRLQMISGDSDWFAVLRRLSAAVALMMMVTALTGGCGSARPERVGTVSDSRTSVAGLPSTRPTTVGADGLDRPVLVESIEALVPTPTGWIAQPLKQGSNHKHQIWISPSDHTAFGVLFVSLPFPAALVPLGYRVDRVLDGFLGEMKKREGRRSYRTQRRPEPERRHPFCGRRWTVQDSC